MNKTFSKSIVCMCMIGLLFVCNLSNAEAVSLWGTSVTNPADLSDSRAYSTTLGGNYPGLVFTWNITFNQSTNLWDYSYSFNNVSPNVSHFILELTDDVEDGDLYGIENYEIDTWAPSPGNPGFPTGAEIYGIKFDFGALNYTLSTERSPVWGNFYCKGGGGPQSKYAYNYALGIPDFESSNKLDFIVRPNGEPVIPEPATLSLLGLGLLGLVGFRKKRE